MMPPNHHTSAECWEWFYQLKMLVAQYLWLFWTFTFSYEMNVITSRCKNEIHAFFLLLNFRVLRQILLSLPPILDMLFLLFFIMVIFAMLGKKWGKIVIEKSVVSFYVVHYKKKIYKKVLVTNWNSISVITPSIPKLNDFWRIVIL